MAWNRVGRMRGCTRSEAGSAAVHAQWAHSAKHYREQAACTLRNWNTGEAPEPLTLTLSISIVPWPARGKPPHSRPNQARHAGRGERARGR